ncbi:MAG: CPBP family intramembrane metalloprotease [Candidatus Aureabacteria bacterium]|nr:CPBP family intramembrane metalloprotease [Candidatus Auribacterota bacterium]
MRTTRKRMAWLGLLCVAVAMLGLLSGRMADEDQIASPDEFRPPTEAELLHIVEEAGAESSLFRVLSWCAAGLIAAGVVMDLYLLWRLLAGGLPRASCLTEARWDLWDLATAVLVFLAVYFAMESMSLFMEQASGAEYSAIVYPLAVQCVAELAALWAILRLVRAHGGGNLAGERRGGWRALTVGVSWYIAFLPVLLALTWATEVAAGWFGIRLEPQEPLGLFFADLGIPSMIFLLAFVCVAGPVIEELFFRGFAYRALRRGIGRWPAILVTAILFAALHANLAVFLPIIALGILLAWVFETSGSLLPSIVIHICQNGVAVAGALLVRMLSRG